MARQCAPIYEIDPRQSLAIFRRLLPVGAMLDEAVGCTTTDDSSAPVAHIEGVGGAASQEAANPFAAELSALRPHEISVSAELEKVLDRRVQESTAKMAQ